MKRETRALEMLERAPATAAEVRTELGLGRVAAAVLLGDLYRLGLLTRTKGAIPPRGGRAPYRYSIKEAAYGN